MPRVSVDVEEECDEEVVAGAKDDVTEKLDDLLPGFEGFDFS